MTWLFELVTHESVAHSILIIAFVVGVGIAIGKIKIFGINIGIAGVLFAGIAAAHFNIIVNKEVLEFLRDFGLILFVYSIGLQVGPGFFASLKKQGLSINMLAVGIVLLGIMMTLCVHFFFHVPMPTAVGIMSGAVTNTPGLGAAQQALNELPSIDATEKRLTGVGYAIAYPFGIIGIILTMLLVYRFSKINLSNELENFNKNQSSLFPPLENIGVEVKNPQLVGQPLHAINDVLQSDIVFSRMMHGQEVFTPTHQTLLSVGDILYAVGTKATLQKLILLVGNESHVDLKEVPSQLMVNRIIVTQKSIIGKTLGELRLRNRYGVNITRINRSGIEFVPNISVTLNFGDVLTVVGDNESLKQLAEELGNSIKKLEHPEILHMMIGIAAGIILGSIPIAFPGLSTPLKLGLAGGPLIIAILLSRIGRIGKLQVFMPNSANLMLRELGIVLFLACVGLKAGNQFIPTLINGSGLLWMAYGAMITIVPLLIVAFIARYIMKKNFLEICGLLSGAMTDPPALSFAGAFTNSEAPAITYATVYPLVTFMRIMGAQLLVLLFAR